MRENEHLTPETFDGLLRCRLHPEDAAASYGHLTECFTCRAEFFDLADEAVATHLAEVFGPQRVAEWRGELETGPRGRSEPGDLAAYDLYGELETLPPARWPLGVANAEAYQSEMALAALLEAAKERWAERPEESRLLILAARRALDLMREKTHEVGWAAWRGRVEAFEGNLHRIFGRFEEAREALDRAEKWLTQAESGPGQHAELAWFRGLLARDERRFDDATELLEGALREPALTGGYTMRAETTLVLGNVYGDAGLPEKAIATKERLLQQTTRAELGPRNYLFLIQSLTINYAHVGRVEEARNLLQVVKELAAELDLGVNVHRVTWAGAEVRRAQGLRPVAASLYREVYQAFQAEGMPYDAALAALSLAEMHLAEGDAEAAAELAEELVPIFRSRGIHREATMAGLVLVQALQRKAATVDHVQSFTDRFRDWRDDVMRRG